MLFRQLTAILGGLSLAAAGPLAAPHEDAGKPGSVSKRTIPDTHVLHERQLPQWSQNWKRGAKVGRDALLPMRIGLKQRNLEEGAELLHAL